MRRALFICSRNRLRSPTAEAVFAAEPGVEALSAGLDHDSDVSCSSDLLEWADIVFVMERSHGRRLRSRFARHLRTARVVCLDVPDRYTFMQAELVALLRARVTPHLRRGSSRSRDAARQP